MVIGLGYVLFTYILNQFTTYSSYTELPYINLFILELVLFCLLLPLAIV